MKYKCVSYPAFEPEHTWLRQMLLFVDEIHRIVPAHEKLDDSDDLKRLMQHCPGAIRRCPPQNYVEVSPTLASLFGKALDQPKFRRKADARKLIITIGPGGELEVEGWELLHVEKIGSCVREELEGRGMLRNLIGDSRWLSVPRGVAGLVLAMLADSIAGSNGFDAVTDQPLAFALAGLYGCSSGSSAHVEGIVASAVATAHVPKHIALLSAKEYAELRKQHAEVRYEFATMVRELKDATRLDRIAHPAEFRARIDEITERVGNEMVKFRQSRTASKVNDWGPFLLTTLVPVAATYAFGPIPGAVTGVFSFGVNAIAKVIGRTSQFRYPKVLQTLCSVNDAAANAALKRLAR